VDSSKEAQHGCKESHAAYRVLPFRPRILLLVYPILRRFHLWKVMYG
jgi:hypothetical protein